MIDIWGMIWLIAAVMVFPFGYKPLIFLLSSAAIFNASKIMEIGDTTISLFFGLELIAILRLLLPYKGSGFPKFNDRNSFLAFFLIFIMWIYTFVVANLYTGMRVYAGYADSFEQNYYANGLPLVWGKSNIIFLIYMSVHIVLALLFYKRKYHISKNLYLKALLFSLIIFCFSGFLWLFMMDLYEALCLLMFNNLKLSIAVFHGDPRFHGTFTEPSVAGLFIAALSIPFIFFNNILYRIFGIILLLFSAFNISSTVFLGLIVSFLITYFYSFKSSYRYLFLTFVGLLSLCFFILIYGDLALNYYNIKNVSDSGMIRSSSNVYTLNNLLDSYLLGLGVGSVKASSMFISYFANFGIVLGFFIIYFIFKLFDYSGGRASRLIFIILIISIIISSFSIPEFTLSFIWNLIFASICHSCSNSEPINEKSVY